MGCRTELGWREMEADELQTISAMVEESSKTNESVGQFVDEAARCPANILRHKSIDQCEGAAMPDLHEQSGDCAAAEIHIDTADDDSSDGDYEQDPEGSDYCDSTDSDDVEAFEEGLDPNPSQVAPGVGFQRNICPRPKQDQHHVE